MRNAVEPFVGVLRSLRRAKRWCGEAARTQGGPGTKVLYIGKCLDVAICNLLE